VFVLVTTTLCSSPDSYGWSLYIATDLVTPVQTGTVATGIGELFLTGLDASTDYVLIMVGVCGEDESSPVQIEFTTNESGDVCGEYELTMDDGTPDHTFATITYIGCDGEEHNVVVTNTRLNNQFVVLPK